MSSATSKAASLLQAPGVRRPPGLGARPLHPPSTRDHSSSHPFPHSARACVRQTLAVSQTGLIFDTPHTFNSLLSSKKPCWLPSSFLFPAAETLIRTFKEDELQPSEIAFSIDDPQCSSIKASISKSFLQACIHNPNSACVGCWVFKCSLKCLISIAFL